MKKKHFITVIIAMLLLSGCVPGIDKESSNIEPSEQSSEINSSENSGRDNSIPFTEVPMVFVSGESVSLIIKSTEALSTALSENDWLLRDLPYWWNDFTTDFFTNEALIIYSTITPSISLMYLIEDLQLVDGVVKLALISRLYGNLMLDALGFASFVIRVSQSDVANITSFETTIRQEIVDELMGIYTLQEAYQGVLTIDDIKHIGFFVSGQLYEINPPDTERVIIDFVPQIEKPKLSMLNENVIEKMKISYYLLHKKIIDQELYWLKQNGYMDQNIKGIDTIEVFAFFGEYNGAFAVKITSNLFEYPSVIEEVRIDNKCWDDSPPQVVIFI